MPLSREIAAQLAEQSESYLEISGFDSIPDFIERGIGYTIFDGVRVMGGGYFSLVCSAGIQVSIYVEEQYRQKGVATALASRLLSECLKLGLRPNWDAANPESFRLAKKLGYTFIGTYNVFFHRE